MTRCRSVNGAYVAGWMCSEASPATAAEYLARSGTMFDLSKGRQRYLPIFEPYRMALLADDPQAESFLQRWLGPFIHWMFIDTCGTVRTVSRHAGSTTSRGAAGLDRTQFEAQERIPTARLVVMAIEQSGFSIASQSERRIDEVMVQAARAGLRDTEDVVFYALNTFTLGAAWALHPRAAAVIQQVASQPELRLAKAMSDLPDHVLEEIASGARSRP